MIDRVVHEEDVVDAAGFGKVHFLRRGLESLLDLVAALPLAFAEAAEEFLFGDLVTYAADPTAAEQRLLRDMQPEAATSVRTLLLTSGLSDVRGALSSVASRLKQQRLWPMPLMRIDGLDHDADESWTVQLSVFGRGA